MQEAYRKNMPRRKPGLSSSPQAASLAADDFRMIRARIEELRRERAQVLAETRGRSAIHPMPYRCAVSSETEQ